MLGLSLKLFIANVHLPKTSWRARAGRRETSVPKVVVGPPDDDTSP